MKPLAKNLASLVLPVSGLVVIPLLIEWDRTIYLDAFGIAGFIFIMLGLALMVTTIRLFIRTGKGTLAPWSPTQHLVVAGIYRHTRNPMITSVLTVLLGESLVVHSCGIFLWTLLFFIINNIYFSLSEEPGLIRRFGEEYLDYRAHVPRWIPRAKPWTTSRQNEDHPTNLQNRT